MRTFKLIDVRISILLICGFAVVCSIRQDLTIITAYFVVGGWQVVSMIVHAVTQVFVRPVGMRLVYHWISFILLVTMPHGSIWILVFAAPFMAVFYTWLCYSELRKMNERPLDILK